VRAYELLTLLNPTLSEDERAAVVERIQGLITGDGSVLDAVDEWGKRKLAYAIDKLNDGDYILFEFHAQPSAIAEIDRVLHITDAVVRFVIVRRDDKE
jgi:small subunit ribosomal protein S6